MDVIPVTDAVGTFLPSPISSYFPAVSATQLPLAELATPVSRDPVQYYVAAEFILE